MKEFLMFLYYYAVGSMLLFSVLFVGTLFHQMWIDCRDDYGKPKYTQKDKIKQELESEIFTHYITNRG